MVGLSVVLESEGDIGINSRNTSKKGPKIITKCSKMIRPSSSSSSSSSASSSATTGNFLDDFLQYCFLCRKKLSPSEDIYMYKGNMAFCSKECRCRQILMDEAHENETSKK